MVPFLCVQGAPGEAAQNIRVALSDNEEDTDEDGDEEGEEEEVPLEAAKLKEMEKNALGLTLCLSPSPTLCVLLSLPPPHLDSFPLFLCSFSPSMHASTCMHTARTHRRLRTCMHTDTNTQTSMHMSTNSFPSQHFVWRCIDPPLSLSPRAKLLGTHARRNHVHEVAKGH